MKEIESIGLKSGKALKDQHIFCGWVYEFSPKSKYKHKAIINKPKYSIAYINGGKSTLNQEVAIGIPTIQHNVCLYLRQLQKCGIFIGLNVRYTESYKISFNG